jgi:glc operon protein GlcG
MSNSLFIKSALTGIVVLGFASSAMSQVVPYGSNVSLEQAKKVIAGSIAEARKLNIPMAIAIVDTAGKLVAFERMDDTQSASIEVARDKAISAATYKRSTKAFQDTVAGGGAGLRILALRDASPLEGGVPIVVGGRIVGAVGVSGGTSDQDGIVAKGGLDELVK